MRANQTPVACHFVLMVELALLSFAWASPLDADPSDSSEASALLSRESLAFGAVTRSNGSAKASSSLTESAIASSDVVKLNVFFGTDMEMNVTALPLTAARLSIPWPGSYWAEYLDSINYRWDSSQRSPAEKYATAFELDVANFTTAVSRDSGILSRSSRTVCSVDADCSGLNDGSVCAIRLDETQGSCIPTWFGICHAWAPAALLEPEPKCAVEKNGVTFQPMDLKALVSAVYDDSDVQIVFAGMRFYGPDSDATVDQYGRYTSASRRDLGPGFMHVALANTLGRLNSSVVLDVTGGAQVWNQPVYSYEVLAMTELTPGEAGSEFYGTTTYPFNDAAERVMYTETRVTWTVESFEDGGLVSSGRAQAYLASNTYTYLLELDADYTVLGGEWLGDSNADHPDFLWLPKGTPALSTVTATGIRYQAVRELLELAANCTASS